MTGTASIPIPSPTRATPGGSVPLRRLTGLLIGPAAGTFAFNGITVTLPQIRAGFGAADTATELVMAGYGIPFAVLLVLGGRLGDRFGRRLLFGLGMGLFLIAAIACSLAPTVELLIAARVLQGVGAALCTPQVLGTIQATTTGTARIRAISTFGAGVGIGAALGQVLGGALAAMDLGDVDGWRAVFWVIALIAALAIALATLAPESRSPANVSFDAVGTTLLGTGILTVSIALTFGPAVGWAWPVLAALIVGAALLAALWRYEDTVERSGRIPLLPPSVVRIPALRLGLVAAGLFFAGYGAILFVIPRAIETGLGMTSLDAGLLMVPFAIVFTLVSVNTARIEARLGRATLIWGVSGQIIALAALAAISAVSWSASLMWVLQPALLLLGAGQALIFSPLTQIVVREVPVDAAGLSGGLFSTVQQLSLSLGVIAVGGFVAANGWTGQSELVAGALVDVAIALLVLALAILLVRRRPANAPL